MIKSVFLLILPLVSSVSNILHITSSSTDKGINQAVGDYYDDGEAYNSIRFRLDSTDTVKYLYRNKKGIWAFTGSEANIMKGKGTIVSTHAGESPIGLSFKYYASGKWATDDSFSVDIIEEEEVVEEEEEEEEVVEEEEEEEEAPLPDPDETVGIEDQVNAEENHKTLSSETEDTIDIIENDSVETLESKNSLEEETVEVMKEETIKVDVSISENDVTQIEAEESITVESEKGDISEDEDKDLTQTEEVANQNQQEAEEEEERQDMVDEEAEEVANENQQEDEEEKDDLDVVDEEADDPKDTIEKTSGSGYEVDDHEVNEVEEEEDEEDVELPPPDEAVFNDGDTGSDGLLSDDSTESHSCVTSPITIALIIIVVALSGVIISNSKTAGR